MTEKFRAELEATRYVRAPLRVDDAESQEVRHLKKEVLQTRLIDDMQSLDGWYTVTDHARMELSDERAVCGKTSLKFSSPTRIGHYELAQYRIISQPKVVKTIAREDWRDWNRLSVWIYPDMPGFHSIVLRVQLMNDGERKVPDVYEREAQHNMNLKPGQWNHMTVEIPDIYRDCVTGLSFEYDMCGHEPKGCEHAAWYIDKIELQKVECDKYIGWQPGKDRIAFSHPGYQAGSKKTAVAAGLAAASFKVLELDTGKVALEKAIEKTQTSTGEFQVLDFSEITQCGRYLIIAGDVTTRAFSISDSVWETSIWKALNFMLTQRCGYAIPTLHEACHADSIVRHPDGRFVIANGGWHDAADMSQNATTSSQATFALFELARRLEQDDPLLFERLLEEGKWGLDWLMKTRFGDGYRALSCGTSCWTNGIHGDQDDVIFEALDIPIENMMAAGAEAIAAALLKEREPHKAAYALKCAKEDWQLGYERREGDTFHQKGDPARIISPLLAYSTAAWSAVEIYRACGEQYYADKAVECARYVMDCQQKAYPDWDIPAVGFFYRDTQRTLIQQYNHRSHEAEPLLALTYLMQEFQDHPDYMKWYESVLLYSEYQRLGVKATAPFEMAAACIYNLGEAEADKELFMKQQPQFNERIFEEFRAQALNGYSLGKGYYLRRFPIWFSYRGNTALVLSSAKAAAMCGKMRNEYDIAEIAQRQMEWVLGRNSFSQSLMYGEGYDFSQQYIQLPGEQVGELAVGMQSFENLDSPYWPQVNTATYKEVWVHSALRWFWAAADAYGPTSVHAYVPYAPGEKLTFTNTLSGQAYAFEPEYKTGKIACKIPAGRYEMDYMGKKISRTFVAAKRYELNGFMGYQAEHTEKAGKVTLSVRITGQGNADLWARASNIQLDADKKSGKAGDTVVFTGSVIDTSRPWVALFVPNGNMDEAFEAYKV